MFTKPLISIPSKPVLSIVIESELELTVPSILTPEIVLLIFKTVPLAVTIPDSLTWKLSPPLFVRFVAPLSFVTFPAILKPLLIPLYALVIVKSPLL